MITNKHGKCLDTLDIVILQSLARQLTNGSYSIMSETGVAICGYVSDGESVRFIAIGWK